MSHKPQAGKEDQQGGLGDESGLPLGGLQADPADPADKPARWRWYDLGLNERERQPEPPRTSLGKENIGRPQGLVKLNQTCRGTPKFPRPVAKNLTKKNVGGTQGVVNAKQICMNSPRYPNPSEKRNKVCGTTLQYYPRTQNQVRKTTTQAGMIKNLRDVRKNLIKQPRDTPMRTAEKSNRVEKVEEAAEGTPHKGKVEGSLQPASSKAGTTGAPQGQILNSCVAVAVLLVLHMVMVQLFGYFWYSVAAMDD